MSNKIISIDGDSPVKNKVRTGDTLLAVNGKEITEELAEAAGEAAVAAAEPFEANKYKIQIAKTLVKRTLLGM